MTEHMNNDIDHSKHMSYDMCVRDMVEHGFSEERSQRVCALHHKRKTGMTPDDDMEYANRTFSASEIANFNIIKMLYEILGDPDA